MIILSYSIECLCTSIGSKNEKCDKTTGQCSCKVGFISTKCDGCAIGFTGNACNKCMPGYDKSGYPDCRNTGNLNSY